MDRVPHVRNRSLSLILCKSARSQATAKERKWREFRRRQLLTLHDRVAKVETGRLRPARRLRAKQRPRRLARPRTPPFHGDNTGSNPVGDANKTKDLAASTKILAGPKRSNKDFTLPLGRFQT